MYDSEEFIYDADANLHQSNNSLNQEVETLNEDDMQQKIHEKDQNSGRFKS